MKNEGRDFLVQTRSPAGRIMRVFTMRPEGSRSRPWCRYSSSTGIFLDGLERAGASGAWNSSMRRWRRCRSSFGPAGLFAGGLLWPSGPDVFRHLLSQYRVTGVFTNEDYEPYARERDREVADLLAREGAPGGRTRDGGGQEVRLQSYQGSGHFRRGVKY